MPRGTIDVASGGHHSCRSVLFHVTCASRGVSMQVDRTGIPWACHRFKRLSCTSKQQLAWAHVSCSERRRGREFGAVSRVKVLVWA